VGIYLENLKEELLKMNDALHEPLTGKILFVDDEKSILKSLEREFLDSGYDVYLASGAQEALKVMERENIDILVSDYKMPGMNGIELLKIVRKKHPTAYRVVLSGFVDQHEALRVLSTGLATVYIPKPWDPDALRREIEHLFTTRRTLNNVEILKAVNSIEELPSLSGACNDFLRAVEAERPFSELALIIMRDIAITAKFLRIAGSAYYRLDRNISIERALSYIGINAIKEILIFSSIAAEMEWSKENKELLRGITIHSILVNYCIGELYSLKFEGSLPERFSSIGITHDIGKVIMLRHLPDRYIAALEHERKNPGADFYQSEVALGFEGATHAEIGAFFLGLWGLTRASTEASLYHHDPENMNGMERQILEICHVANQLANYIAVSPDATGENLPSFLEGFAGKDDPELRDLLIGVRKRWEELQRKDY
jgi:CheY-like chemotaxis protein